ncbi:MAG TPA: endonuclease NucS [Micrococcales bacterium]|uniref:Endonuclease NucS n=1 Tax=Miniimonas arenae TaxID=676201 RepID=A0A5C5BET8_9MICO|nr:MULTISPECIES: endonuclease NucS [Miniimonas]TNU76160.1 endonuclease NucS [Miniimonas arenae]HCX86359.1 endonuclease NucS [Micrococcales bacterium]
MRVLVATCAVDYSGRLSAHLPLATRVIMVKADGSVLVHSDGGSYKPLNWMSPPCTVRVTPPSVEQAADGVREVWTVSAAKSEDQLVIALHEVLHDVSHDLGVDPGLVKDGVEAHLQKLLAEQVQLLGAGHTLVRREFPTAIGPVDLMVRTPGGASVEAGVPVRHVAVEIKRRATIDAVEQLTRYLELLNRDPLLAPVRGVLAAQSIAPQARTLAVDRGIACLVLDYDAMRGVDDPDSRLF